jgi:hypothetical protein
MNRLEAAAAVHVAESSLTWGEVETDFGTHRAMKIWTVGMRLRNYLFREQCLLMRMARAEAPEQLAAQVNLNAQF